MSATLTYPNPFERFFAYLLDIVVLVLPSGVIGGMLVRQDAVTEEAIIAPIGILVMFLVKVLYYTLFLSGKWQATPGQRIMNMHVIRVDGKKLNQRDALERYLAMILPELPLYASFLPPVIAALGFIWLTIFWFSPMFTNAQRVGMHDKLTHTRVVAGQAK